MNGIDLNKSWVGPEAEVDLPYDRLPEQMRNYNLENGEENSYYPPVYFALSRSLSPAHCHKNILEIDGACGTVDVAFDGVLADVVTSRVKRFIDLGSIARKTELTLSIAAADEGKYTGAGIAGGVRLHTAENPVYIPPYGVTVVTDRVEEKAYLNVTVELVNDTGFVQKPVIEAVVLNARGKRVGKRQKKVKLMPASSKTVVVPVRVSRFYLWTLSDPYLYTCNVTVSDTKVLDTASVRFGIRTLRLEGRSFVLNGKPIKLRGGTVVADNGLLGTASYPTAEKRKFAVLKEAGYNAVRVTQPTAATLDALDELGLLAVVDLLDVWRQPKHPLDRHRYFEKDVLNDLHAQLSVMKSRPSVIAYSLGSDLPESYGRGDGLQLLDMLSEAVRGFDPTRPLMAELSELDPTDAEIAAFGGKSHPTGEARLSFAREKDMFRKLTEGFRDKLDLVGYNNLSHRYPVDRLVSRNIVLGTASSPKRVFESCDDGEKNGVIGEMAACAVDYLGAPKYKPPTDMLPMRSTFHGDVDIAGFRKPISFYREIVYGVRPRSYIVVTPDDERRETDEWEPMQGEHLWNWPRHVGKPVTVEVYTSGDVVALYLDGKLLGRKLAGKINRHIATFKTNYYPGKLEAVSFHRGVEHSRTTLETVTSPKMIKLSSADKAAHLDGDGLCYIDIEVCDAAGRLVPFAQREVTVSVTGDAKLLAVGNGDPHCVTPSTSETVPVFDGHAVAVVKGLQAGKAIVKVTSDGLLCGRMTVKVKDA